MKILKEKLPTLFVALGSLVEVDTDFKSLWHKNLFGGNPKNTSRAPTFGTCGLFEPVLSEDQVVVVGTILVSCS
jgi:hypothetical protein